MKSDQPKYLGEKSAECRAAAKMLGGQPLTGSMAQKEWAEKIRAGKLERMAEAHAALAVDPKIPFVKTAKFWIETRFMDAPAIGAWLAEHRAMVEELAAIKSVWERSRAMGELEHRITMHKMRIGLMPGKRP